MKLDPKPKLGTAAIESNIEYYQKIAQDHFDQFNLAANQAGYWTRELEQLKKELA